MNATARLGVSRWQQIALVVLRVAIGWHFLYEGYVKLIQSGWSAASYLKGAVGPFAPLFHQMAASPTALRVVNLLNEWGLVAVGLGLIVGLLTRPAALGGMLMLVLYYLANPPWIGVLARPGEGNYLWVDKNLVELLALAVILTFDTGKMAGLDLAFHELRSRLRARRAARKEGSGPQPAPPQEEASGN